MKALNKEHRCVRNDHDTKVRASATVVSFPDQRQKTRIANVPHTADLDESEKPRFCTLVEQLHAVAFESAFCSFYNVSTLFYTTYFLFVLLASSRSHFLSFHFLRLDIFW